MKEVYLVDMKFKLDSLLDEQSFSFDGICKKCGENLSECICKVGEVLEPCKHKLCFRLEKRNGKPVTVIAPFAISAESTNKLLSTLKKRLACGGSVKCGAIELQGDLKDRAKIVLEQCGFGFKK